MFLGPLLALFLALSGQDNVMLSNNENHDELVEMCIEASEEKYNWQYRGIVWDPLWSLSYYNNFNGVTTVIARGDDAAGIVYWADCEYRDGKINVLDIAPGPFENDLPEDF